MNATMVASGTKVVPPPVSSIQDIPLERQSANPKPTHDAFSMKRSWLNSQTTSNNTAYSNRFSCARFPMGKRARMS
jgi:hypothetical protein